MSLEKRPSRYHPKEIKRLVKTWYKLRSQRRYAEANRIVRMYRYPVFWLPIIFIVGLYFSVWGILGDATKSTSVPNQSVISRMHDFDQKTNNHDGSVVGNRVFDFRKGKRALYPIYEKLGQNFMKTFYCGCDFSLRPKRYKKDLCGIVVTKYVKATGVDAEHIMPISLIGHTLDCWKNGGRKNCGRVDNFFRMAEGDLHNLVPAVPTINRLRSNYPPVASIAGEKRDFGECDVEIKGKKFEPPLDKRGDIARAYLYMRKTYDALLTTDEVKMFMRWHQDDPATDEEIKIHNAKAKVQGNINPFY
ncbi:MAG: endonuclease [Thiomargarita sp.]|nr:endonuclease [Thiomargarita sp.]